MKQYLYKVEVFDSKTQDIFETRYYDDEKFFRRSFASLKGTWKRYNHIGVRAMKTVITRWENI